MTASPDILTIGHSNLPAEQFTATLKAHAVTTVVDVRSVPFSRRFPWFSSRTLSDRLQTKGIAYVMLGDLLGGRPVNPELYSGDIADYEAMSGTADFLAGIDRLVVQMRHQRLCLMCSEREPLDCHRCLLVGRALAERGYSVGHILGDGTIECHSATEARLLNDVRPSGDLLAAEGHDLAEAYRRRTLKVAARLSDRIRPGRTPRARAAKAAFMPF